MAKLETTAWLRRRSQLLPLAGDLLLVPAAMLLAWQLRFGLQLMPVDFFRSALALSPLVMVAVVPARWLADRYCLRLSRLWRLGLAAMGSGVAGAVLIVLLHGTEKVPRSSLLLLGPVLWFFWLAWRAAYAVLVTYTSVVALPLHTLARAMARHARAACSFAAARWRQALDLLLLVAFSGVLYRVFQDRALAINNTFGDAWGCSGCLTRSLFLHDYLYLGMLLLLFVASIVARRYFLFLPLRLLAVVGVLVYVADIVVFDEFFTRLMLSDIRIYGEQLPIVWRHVAGTDMFAEQSWLGLLVFAAALCLLFLPPVGKPTRRALVALAILPVVAISSGSVFTPPSYVHDWALRNVLAANFNTGVTEPYSEELRSELLQVATGRPRTCRAGSNAAPDIVVLVLESWSPFQSRQWGGMEDWTPRLDELARRNAWYARLHAGGFTTNEGLISIFTGLEYIAPLKAFLSLRPFETAWETPASIPGALAANGNYHTAFLTSGNLGFSRKGQWLTSLGFHYVEGHDHPAYDDLPRLHFDAAADEYLYARSLDYLRERRGGDQPLLLAIENVSSHHPYIHPITGERSAEAVFRYMDEAAYAFYQELQGMNFFDNGLLLIVSDHRAMVPISVEESERFGQMAASRVPALVVGGGLQGEIATPFHQSDILPSLAALTADEFCHTGPYRNMLEPEATESRCLYHARGDNRDHIDAFCPLVDGSEARAVIRLDGDDTRVVSSEGLTPELEQQVLLEINTHRIVGDERTRRLLESGYFN